MRTVKTQDLTPGMITAEPVLSKHGQLIVAADTELTNQMIAHLSYYNIPSASIVDGTIPSAAIASMQKDGTGNPVLFTKRSALPVLSSGLKAIM